MKAILRKDKDHYRLFVEDKQIGSTGTRVSSKEMYQLSFENCDEIFGVFDVEKLAEESKNEYVKRFNNISKSDYMNGFEGGFNKAMELNKYTEEDIMKAYDFGSNALLGVSKNNLIQSLQQPTEIEVEVITEEFESYNENLDIIKKSILDSEGCLILKKI